MTEQDVEFEALTQKIARERGFGCASYKEKCLRRRIAVRMRARAVHSYADYALLLDGDAVEYEKLLDALTINVTRLFRNWEVYEAMRTQVVPSLWELDAPELRVWSAGCSSGEEPYSLAVLLHRDAMERGLSSRLGRVRILGTDIDKLSLAAAEKGEFEEGDFADTPEQLRRDYFAPAAPFRVADGPRKLVRFEQRDLLREDAPPGPHNLVVCRNVLIYFDRPTQERLFAKFHEALPVGGFLVLGKVETLLGTIRTKFASVNARERIFRKL